MSWEGQDRRVIDSNLSDKLDKLADTMNEIKERVVRMETRQEDQIKRAEKTEQVAYEAERKASEALLQCKDNEKDLEVAKLDFQNQLKDFRQFIDDRNRVFQWIIGGLVTICIGIGTMYFQAN